jgi:hypothetical protein
VNISEILIYTTEDVSTPSSDKLEGSSTMPTPLPPKRAPKSDPPGRFNEKMKNHKLVYIPPTKNNRTQHKHVMCVHRKISRKKLDLFACSAVFLFIQKAAINDIIH